MLYRQFKSMKFTCLAFVMTALSCCSVQADIVVGFRDVTVGLSDDSQTVQVELVSMFSGSGIGELSSLDINVFGLDGKISLTEGMASTGQDWSNGPNVVHLGGGDYVIGFFNSGGNIDLRGDASGESVLGTFEFLVGGGVSPGDYPIDIGLRAAGRNNSSVDSGVTVSDSNFSVVPEPSSSSVLLLIGCIVSARRRR